MAQQTSPFTALVRTGMWATLVRRGSWARAEEQILNNGFLVSSTPSDKTEEAFTLLERLFSKATKTFTGGATNYSCLGQKSIQA